MTWFVIAVAVWATIVIVALAAVRAAGQADTDAERLEAERTRRDRAARQQRDVRAGEVASAGHREGRTRTSAAR